MARLTDKSTARAMALTAELVALCERPESDPGPEAGLNYLTEHDFDAATERLLAQAPRGKEAIAIFAYGSLIWKPVFDPLHRLRARAYGWHRAFSLELVRWRGTPDQLGLMMGLERGGCCDGLIDRLDPNDQPAQLGQLLRREISTVEELSGVRWITVETAHGKDRALAFWAGPTGLHYVRKRPLEDVAAILSRACGHIGSGAGYLYQTVAKLQELGIHDRNLWRLQQLVAEEIRQLHAPAAEA
jgi:cation transport protein ChaC